MIERNSIWISISLREMYFIMHKKLLLCECILWLFSIFFTSNYVHLFYLSIVSEPLNSQEVWLPDKHSWKQFLFFLFLLWLAYNGYLFSALTEKCPLSTIIRVCRADTVDSYLIITILAHSTSMILSLFVTFSVGKQ